MAVKEIEDSTVVLVDPLTFVDTGCNEFLAELSLATTSYTTTFTNPGTGQLEVEAGQRLEDWGGEPGAGLKVQTQAKVKGHLGCIS